jgi:hypothetical protein
MSAFENFESACLGTKDPSSRSREKGDLPVSLTTAQQQEGSRAETTSTLILTAAAASLGVVKGKQANRPEHSPGAS